MEVHVGYLMNFPALLNMYSKCELCEGVLTCDFVLGHISAEKPGKVIF